MMETSAPESTAVITNRCTSCPSPKPASWCSGCPREKDCHFVDDARIQRAADVIIITESPVIGRFVDMNSIHSAFMDDAGKLLKNAIHGVQTDNPSLANLRVAKTYAVICSSKQEPNKETLDRCKGFLYQSIANATGDKTKPPIIIAMGMSAVRALGIKAAKLSDVQSRILPGVEINGTNYTVIPTISSKMLVAMAGLYTTFYGDLIRAFRIAATEEIVSDTPMSELTKNYIIPATVAEAKDLCEHIIGYSEEGKSPDQWSISVDTETNTKFPHRDTLKMLAVSFAWATGRAAAIPLWHPETPFDPEEIAPYIRRVLACQKPKSFHNAKFDLKVFMKYGWDVTQFRWDTMLAEHALEEDKKGFYGLKQITRATYPEFASYADKLHEALEKAEGDSQLDNIRKAQKAATSVAKPKKKKGEDGGFEKISLQDLLIYAAIDTDITRRISVRQIRRIAEEDRAVATKRALLERDRRAKYKLPVLCKAPSATRNVIMTEAVPLVPVLARMEFNGIRVHQQRIQEFKDKLTTVIDDSAKSLYEMAGDPDLKLNGHSAIANVLFKEGFIHPTTGVRTFYPPYAFTAKGQAQTNEKSLKYFVAKYGCPFSAKKLIYSKASKASNTFLQNVGDLSAMDGRLHTNYNIHGTATRRLSSNDENMQNIPKKLAGLAIKSIFIPTDPDSQVFVNCDAKNAEVRIFSAYSQDQELINSINDGMDTHAFFAARIVEAVRLEPHTAADVLGSMGLDDTYPLTYEDFAAREEIKLKNKKYGEQLDAFRTAVKRVVFGILYGAGPAKIAETIGISREQAQSIIDMLFQMFPSIPTYIEKTKWELHQMGFVETFFGVRRRFAVRGATGYLRSRAERQGVNFKIQSTSSSIVMACLIDTEGPLERDIGGRLLLTVHDSIGFEWPKKYLSQLPDFVHEHLVKRATAKYPWLPVEFKWDFELGPSYGELGPYDAYMKNVMNVEEQNDAKEAYTEEEVRIELASTDEA